MATLLNRVDRSGSSGYLSAAVLERAASNGRKDMNRFNRLNNLRSLYRSTFDEWASQVVRLDEISASAQEGRGLRAAQQRTAQAETGYRDVRNRLVEEMAAGAHS